MCVAAVLLERNRCAVTEALCLTSGAIQKGVPTDVFRRSRALVS